MQVLFEQRRSLIRAERSPTRLGQAPLKQTDAALGSICVKTRLADGRWTQTAALRLTEVDNVVEPRNERL